jgi:UDPglucose--hexose-1-phosphate uridylyltransferase
MPELRIDPVVGRRVYIAEDRAARPNDYEPSPPHSKGSAREEICDHTQPSPLAGSSASQGPSPNIFPQERGTCYFCAGNEYHTPVATATAPGADGRWQVRVVPNKYPAVRLDAEPDAAFGAHEVIVESPDHVLHMIDLSVEQLAVILKVYRDRLSHFAADARLKHAVLFKNAGYAAGASLEHIHSQLVALPFVPAAVQAELDAASSYYDRHRRCVFCDLIARELDADERIVHQADGYVAVCAYAPRQPFETWILPERHAARFDALEDRELAPQAELLLNVLGRLDRASPGAAYNLLLHTGPFDAAEAAFHWHWELVPRLTHEAGLEWGGGVFITPLSPERAAQQLRDAT